MVRFYIIFIMILLGTLIYSSTGAETINVSFSHWPPMKIYTKNSIDGIDARILRELGQRTNMEFKFVECPWARCIANIKEGTSDLITSFGRNVEREKYTHYLEPAYFEDSITFWVRKDSELEINHYGDLAKLKIGVIKGSSYFPEFDQDLTLNKTEVSLEEQLFKMLAAARIDTFVGFETTIKYLLATHHFSDHFRPVTYKQSGSKYYLAMSKKSKNLHLKNHFEEELVKMIDGGEIKYIINTFIRESSEY